MGSRRRAQSTSSVNKTSQWQLACVFRHPHPAPRCGYKRRARANAQQFFAEEPRGIADERDSADLTVTPTRNKTKLKGFVEISTLLIHSAPKQKSNQWMHLSPFYTRVHGEWLRYAKSTSQFHWRFLFSQRWSGLPSKSPMSSRHNS